MRSKMFADQKFRLRIKQLSKSVRFGHVVIHVGFRLIVAFRSAKVAQALPLQEATRYFRGAKGDCG